MFDAADKNGDGALDEGEFNAYMQGSVRSSSLGGAGATFNQLFDQIDANDDQMIDFEEFKKLTQTAAQFADDVTDADCERSAPAGSGTAVTDAPVTNDTSGRGQGQGQNQGGCEHLDMMMSLGDSLESMGMSPAAALKLMIEQGLVDVDENQQPVANDKTVQFSKQLQTLMSESREGVNEVLGQRIEWLVDDGASWKQATEFMFDQGAVKADAKGNIAFNYPKGLSMNHYLCQFMDPKFRAKEQAGSQGLDTGLGQVYDRMMISDKNPITVLNKMLDQGLMSIDDKGSIIPTTKGQDLVGKIDAFLCGQNDGIDLEVVQIYDGLRAQNYTPQNALNYMLGHDLVQITEHGLEQTAATDASAPLLKDFGALA